MSEPFPTETESADMTQLPLFQWFFGPVDLSLCYGDAPTLAFHYQFKYICARRWVVPFRLADGARKNVVLKPVITEDLDLCAWEFDSFETPRPYVPPPPSERCPCCGA